MRRLGYDAVELSFRGRLYMLDLVFATLRGFVFNDYFSVYPK